MFDLEDIVMIIALFALAMIIVVLFIVVFAWFTGYSPDCVSTVLYRGGIDL